MAERLADMLEDPDSTRAAGAAAGIEALICQYEVRVFSAVLPAKSAVPAIEEVLAKNDDEDFKWAARAAIESIQTGE